MENQEKSDMIRVFELLAKGKKVRNPSWAADYFIYVDGEYIKDSHGNLYDIEPNTTDFYRMQIYHPPLTPKEMQIIEYCRTHLEHMWSSTIIGIILDCDFRDAESELRKRGLKYPLDT